MKLLVCDVEGTIFKPHVIKDSEHASYIWTAIASALGKDAEREEMETHRRWRDGKYGFQASAEAYLNWVRDSIRIHRKFGLTERVFYDVINCAPYIDGVEEFFRLLSRDRYIPVLISGGIQNLNYKACSDLNIEQENSFAACEYFFTAEGEIDDSLTFVNTSNFYGKEELVRILLRKHQLTGSDWVFIGDGINDESIAAAAPLSIGISPVRKLKRDLDFAFDSFEALMNCSELLRKERLIDFR